jgi:hydrogenase/urease accessory protein HupE
MSFSSIARGTLALALLVAVNSSALAHPGPHEGRVMELLRHWLSAPDHVLATLAIGAVAAHLGRLVLRSWRSSRAR